MFLSEEVLQPVLGPMKKPAHGGNLDSVIQKFDIAREDWIDLSTGINPNGWPVPVLPSHVYQRLPEVNDALENAASFFYQAHNVLAIAGSQAAIQLLPLLRSTNIVGVVYPGYQEHAYCWQRVGHTVILLNDHNIEDNLEKIDVLVIINPNNPTGKVYSKAQLLSWHSRLEKKNGWLVVDEAFIDVDPSQSLVDFSQSKGLIVLRSLGKFFGLAGLRVGFIFSESSLQQQLMTRIGPWSVSHPSQYIATQALLDNSWQTTTRITLKNSSVRLFKLLARYQLKPDGGTSLFQWFRHIKAKKIFEQFAKQGIFVRLFEESSSLRLGIPENEFAWTRLERALDILKANDKARGDFL